MFEEKATVYESSTQSVRSELMLFSLPPTDITTQYTSDYLQYYPITSLKQSYSPIEFAFSSEGNSYFDLANSYLYLTCRIVRQDGTPCQPSDDVAPCNLFFHNMFSNLQIWLNGTLVSDSFGFYGTVANVQRLLSSNTAQKQGELKNEFYYPDQMPEVFTKDKVAQNPGYWKRWSLSSASTQFSMMGKLVANVFTQNRYFPPQTEFKICLRRNIPDLCINSKTTSLPGFNGCPWRFGKS